MLSLDEAIAVTLTENPALKAAAYEERAAQQQRRAAIGLRMPQINVTGAYAYMAKDIGFDFNDLKGPVKEGVAGGLTALVQNGLIPADKIPTLQGLLNPMMDADWFLKVQDQSLGFVGGEVTVPIWMGGKINAANRAARINEQTARSQGIQQRNALVSELVERYYGLALAQQVVVVRQQVVDGVRKHLEDAAALEAQGMISRSEKLYVEFKMSEAERDLQNAQSQVETIAAALNSTIGSRVISTRAPVFCPHSAHVLFVFCRKVHVIAKSPKPNGPGGFSYTREKSRKVLVYLPLPNARR